MEDTKLWLDKFTQQAKENNVQFHIELINSPRWVEYVLLEDAEKKQIDLVVMGTRGRTGFKFLSASTASSLVTYARCTVLVVK
jgi:nucleotide-binding universal stress UspA family protein